MSNQPTYLPPFARQRLLEAQVRTTLNALSDATPEEIARAGAAGVANLAARADHIHAGVDPLYRLIDGLYVSDDAVAQASGAGNTTWSVAIAAGRAVIGGVTKFKTAGTLTIHSGSNLLPASGDSCIAAVILRLVGGVTGTYASVKGVVSSGTPVAPTDAEIDASVGDQFWVRLSDVTLARTADIADQPAEAATGTISSNSGSRYAAIRAATAGVAGNSIRYKVAEDAVSNVVVIERDGNDFFFHVKIGGGASTTDDVQNAIDALAGGDALIVWNGGGGASWGGPSLPVAYTNMTGGAAPTTIGVASQTIDNDAADTGT